MFRPARVRCVCSVRTRGARFACGDHDLVDLRRGALRALALERDRQLQHPRRRARQHLPRPRDQRLIAAARGRRESTHPASSARPASRGRPGPTCSRSASARTSRPRSASTAPGRRPRGPACNETGRPRGATPPTPRAAFFGMGADPARSRHRAAKGQLVWHNNTPPLSRATSGHASPGPNRNTNARAATPIAVIASANALPAGATGPSSGSSANAQRAKCARIASASRANRRSHPRTVSSGTPSRRRSPGTPRRPPSPTAPRRSPRPRRAAAASTDPAATRACAGTPDTSRAAAATAQRPRTARSRACPHGPSRPAQQPDTPTARRQISLDPRLLGAYHQHRVPPPASGEPSRPNRQDQTGGLSRVHNARNLPDTIPAINRHPDAQLHRRPRRRLRRDRADRQLPQTAPACRPSASSNRRRRRLEERLGGVRGDREHADVVKLCGYPHSSTKLATCRSTAPTPTVSFRSSTAATRAARPSSPATRPSANGRSPSATKPSPPPSSTGSSTTPRCSPSTAPASASTAASTPSARPPRTTRTPPNDGSDHPRRPRSGPQIAPERLTSDTNPTKSTSTDPLSTDRHAPHADPIASDRRTSQRPASRPTLFDGDQPTLFDDP